MTNAVAAELLTESKPAVLGLWDKVTRAARRKPVGVASGFLCVVLIGLAIFGPNISPYDANNISFERLQSPSLSHPFGTDNLSRDMFSRIVFGARNSLGIAFTAIFVSTIIGVVLGITSGYLAGAWDLTVSRIVDVALSYPALVMVIFAVTIFGREFWTIAVAIGIILTPGTIRVVRGATIGVRQQQFVEAAVAIGNNQFRIMYRHILPNVAAPIIVIASLNIGVAILIEATVSFLGLGVSSASNPSWGRMLYETRPSWQVAWWTMIVPGAAISLAVVTFNIFGDALRDWLDPRLRGTR